MLIRITNKKRIEPSLNMARDRLSDDQVMKKYCCSCKIDNIFQEEKHRGEDEEKVFSLERTKQFERLPTTTTTTTTTTTLKLKRNHLEKNTRPQLEFISPETSCQFNKMLRLEWSLLVMLMIGAITSSSASIEPENATRRQLVNREEIQFEQGRHRQQSPPLIFNDRKLSLSSNNNSSPFNRLNFHKHKQIRIKGTTEKTSKHQRKSAEDLQRRQLDRLIELAASVSEETVQANSVGQLGAEMLGIPHQASNNSNGLNSIATSARNRSTASPSAPLNSETMKPTEQPTNQNVAARQRLQPPQRGHKARGAVAEQQVQEQEQDQSFIEPPLNGFSGLDGFETDFVDRTNNYGSPETHLPALLATNSTQRHLNNSIASEQLPRLPGRNREVEGAAQARLTLSPIVQDHELPNSLQQSSSADVNIHSESFPSASAGRRYSPYSSESGNFGDDFADDKFSQRGQRAANIRVVFNNNPQFVIGKEHANLHNGNGQQLDGEQLNRRRGNLYGADHYVSDESRLDETKTLATNSLKPLDELPPCKKERPAQKLNFEHVDMTQQEQVVQRMAPPPSIKQVSQPPAKLPEAQVAVAVDDIKAPRQPPPPLQTKQQQQQQHQVKQTKQLVSEPDQVKGYDDSEQVDTPFEHIVKSGLRPPLRMIISMRSKNGDTMRVPVNLHGSTKQQQRVPAIDLGQQMQVHAEPVQQTTKQQQQIDENTPLGGDLFDPNIVKPFAKISPASKVAVAKTPQQVVTQEQQIDQVPLVAPVKEPPSHLPVPEKSPPQQQQQQQHLEPRLIEAQLTKKADCEQHHHHHHHHHHNAQSEMNDRQQQRAVLGPVEGSVQMLVPQVAEFSNKTFASMFMQFHRALAQQMAGQEQQQVVEAKEPHQEQLQQQQQQQDDQEDLMVAMMTANMSEPIQQGVHRAMTMTVIKPPKGTSLQAAIHEAQTATPGQGKTVAILHTVKSKLNPMNHDRRGPFPSDGAPISPAGEISPIAVDIELRRPVTNAAAELPVNSMPPDAPATGGDPVDEDGFGSGSGSSVNEHYSTAPEEPALRSENSRAPSLWRFKRAAASNESLPYGRLLEDADRLAAQAHRLLKDSHFKLSAREHSELGSTQEARAKTQDSRSNSGAQPITQGSSSAGSATTTTTTIRPKPIKASSKAASRYSEHYGSSDQLEMSARRKLQAQHEKPNTKRSKATKSVGKPLKGKDLIEVAASEQEQQNEIMDSDEDEDDDYGSQNSANDSGGEQEASMAAPSSTSEVGGENANANDEDSSDLGADDTDDGPNFDADDEPYNQGAPSERDYNSPSFEIPQIDINPDSLKQKGCKTVLREVQEIPMNGLGVEQANGRPGSGYLEGAASRSSASHRQPSYRLPGVRVRRQTNNENLINSRKVTSIVMTKECHFPNDGGEQATSGKKSLPSSKRDTDNKHASGDDDDRHDSRQAQHSHAVAQQRLAAPVSMEAAQTVSQVNQGSGRPAYVNLSGGIPIGQAAFALASAAAGRVHQRRPYPIQQALEQRNQLIAAAQHHHQQQQLQQQQQQQRHELARRPSAVQFRADLMPVPMAMQMQMQMQPPHQQVKRRSVALQAAPPLQDEVRRSGLLGDPAQLPARNQNRNQRAVHEHKEQQNANFNANANGQIQQAYSNQNYHRLAPMRSPQRQLERDFYEGADSRRNEVVARKLYKPPSADDPFHTLSYSSQNGADPDRDDDTEDDEAFLAEAETETEQQRRRRRPGRHNKGSPRTAASTRQRASEVLSESEREALLDPNHDDTDPVQAQTSQNDDDPHLAPEQDDADESDVDLMDESRAHSSRREVPLRSGSARGNAAPHNDARRPAANRRAWPAPGQVKQVTQAQAAGEPARRQQAAAHKRSSAAASRQGPLERFGKSFKFTHELSRPQQLISQQLQGLKPGRHEFVRVEQGGPSYKQSATAAAANGQASANRAKRINRRHMNRNEEDPDERDDDGYADKDDADDDEPSTISRRRSSPADQAGADSDADEDDPDADPEYNPKEGHLPAHSKPKKVQKSFAYVHRDVPKKGAKDSDDFVVSYGRGNLQTEHEDYDSDREHSRPQEAQAAEGSALKASLVSLHNHDHGQRRPGTATPTATATTTANADADQSLSGGGQIARQQQVVNSSIGPQRVEGGRPKLAASVPIAVSRNGRSVQQQRGPLVIVANSQYPLKQQHNQYQPEAFKFRPTPNFNYLAGALTAYS